MGAIEQALAKIDEFEAEAIKTVAWVLNRQDTIHRLRDLVRDPQLVDQRGLNVCGPAIFFRVWLARDPIATTRFACSLLRDGSASIGSLFVKPSDKLLRQDYSILRSVADTASPHSMPECTDWMLLSALRDSENVLFDYTGEPNSVLDLLGGPTLPGTLAGWLTATGLYNSVFNKTSLIPVNTSLIAGNLQELLGLIPSSDTDTLLYVNASAIFDVKPAPVPPVPEGNLFVVPNHYVLMTAPFLLRSDRPEWINIDVWSWGRQISGFQGINRFATNYFGQIRATV